MTINHSNERSSALIKKTLAYAHEIPHLSYWHAISTFGLLLMIMGLSYNVSPIVIKAALSILLGLLIARGFILFHDYQHKAILKNSILAKYFFILFSAYIATPPSVWRQSHNFHHAHNTIIDTSFIGSFWTVSVSQWRAMSEKQQRQYRLFRNPLVIAFGILTIFIYDHCIHGFLRNPLKNWSALPILMIQSLVLVAALYYNQGINYLFIWLLPLFVAGALGSYLFYAQHNFPSVTLHSKKEWNYTNAALDGSCFIAMPRIMHWFTGNIAYHHIHHLNPRIPFYRLPATMAGINELQNPKTTSLRWRDIMACLRLKLWDEKQKQMIAINHLPATDS